ncbi:hypothetical protein AB0N62_43030 [Streptomyces sp. NPDC093982]|uniref:hypothetical protein n=1 Tax=Streptomyces sp. NPDC093982 TaxID=3155077 RepID=UPI003447F61C
MTKPSKQNTHAAAHEQDQLSLSTGRAAGYCWARNPHRPGRYRWPPHHSGKHRDHYTHAEWPCHPAHDGLPLTDQS